MKKIFLGFGPLVVSIIIIAFIAQIIDGLVEEEVEEESGVVILDNVYYLSRMQALAKECEYDIECMGEAFKENIPPQFRISAKVIKIESGDLAWQFTCSDTTEKKHDYYGD